MAGRANRRNESMKTVGEVSRLMGISIRTLRYYDQIGLLQPGRVDGSNYRLYGEADLRRLQQILFFRALGFPLSQIASILKNPAFDPRLAMERHRALLTLKRDALDRLIGQMDQILKGETDMENMDLGADLRARLEQTRRAYAEEARERWGDTEPYAECQRKTAGYTEADWAAARAEAAEIFGAFAASRGTGPDAPAVQALVAAWQAHITRRYYACTKEILEQLGRMYTEDQRFRQSIDQYGEGTAQLMREAISHYCKS